MNPCLVSILIPVWNRERLIRDCVESALAQTWPEIEVVVCDNASTDGTWQVLEDMAARDPRLRIFRNPENLGPVRNWMRCIEEARGRYGKILWSDDLLEPQCVARMAECLESRPDVGFVFCKTRVMDEQKQRDYLLYDLNDPPVFASSDYVRRILRFEWKLPVSPGCMMLRMDDLRANTLLEVPNSLNSDFSMHAVGPDLLIFLLTAARYPQVAYLNEPLAVFRAHDGSISCNEPGTRLQCFYRMAAAFFVSRCGLEMLDAPAVRDFHEELGRFLFEKGAEATAVGICELANFYPTPADHQRAAERIAGLALTDWVADAAKLRRRAKRRLLFRHPKKFFKELFRQDTGKP
jgi:glycosyltransferase involved in cell wall biosynthesis